MIPLLNFFHMGGYGFYIWLAYSSVFIFLFLQWIFPWQRCKKNKKFIKHS